MKRRIACVVILFGSFAFAADYKNLIPSNAKVGQKGKIVDQVGTSDFTYYVREINGDDEMVIEYLHGVVEKMKRTQRPSGRFILKGMPTKDIVTDRTISLNGKLAEATGTQKIGRKTLIVITILPEK